VKRTKVGAGEVKEVSGLFSGMWEVGVRTGPGGGWGGGAGQRCKCSADGKSEEDGLHPGKGGGEGGAGEGGGARGHSCVCSSRWGQEGALHPVRGV
jgi:hypothetical protein